MPGTFRSLVGQIRLKNAKYRVAKKHNFLASINSISYYIHYMVGKGTGTFKM